MRLRLHDLGMTFPAAAETAQLDGSLVITAPPLTLVLSPLTLEPAPEPGADAQVVGRDCPPGCHVQILSAEASETDLGWPLRLVHAQVLAADGVTVLEERLGASYQFLRYATAALVRIAGAPQGSAIPRPRLLELLRSGRPDWRETGAVAALCDIWQ